MHHEYFDRLASLLELESKAEVDQLSRFLRDATDSDLEANGDAILDLVITDHDVGLGGRHLVQFVKRNRELNLPWNRLRVGTPVVVSATDGQEERQNGVISARRREFIEVSLEEMPIADRFRVDRYADEITRKRQQTAMTRARNSKGRMTRLRDVLLGLRDPEFDKLPSVEAIGSLNDSQRIAVEFALSSRDIAIIHGPPGTGKTTTLVELIQQTVLAGGKVLVCAPSNAAVDHILEQLSRTTHSLVRLGHPARVASQLKRFTLDEQAATDPARNVIRDMHREADECMRRANRFTRAKPLPGEKAALRKDARQLRDDARRFERQVIQNIIDRADVVCATNSFNSELLGDRTFDLVVIDEACQCIEPSCWIPILHADRIVMAGDHCQLPPTVLSTQAIQEGLHVSMLERLVERFGKTVNRRLDIQYRMHQQIMKFASLEFYDDSLQADDSVASRTVDDLLPEPAPADLAPYVRVPVEFIDTAGAGWDEEPGEGGISYRNIQEAEYLSRRVRHLIDLGIKPKDIGLITPYSAQVRLLQELSDIPTLEVDTVDGFQGREKEVILISCVRSNANGEIGFLSDTRRMNVALTRAKCKLLIVGDSSTISNHVFYGRLIEYLESIDAYRSIWSEDLP